MEVGGVEFVDLKNGKWKSLNTINYKGVLIKKGFITDFRTTPLWAEWLVSKVLPKHHLNYVWHDYMYRVKDKSRLTIDLKQASYLSEDGFSEIQIILVYIFVRLFGKHYWNKYKRFKS